jgi:hypothetical protein
MTVLQAFKKIIKHPILLLPEILLTIFIAVLAKLAIIWTGIQSVVPETGDVSNELLSVFFQENTMQILWPIALFFISTFVIGVGEKVIKLEMITNLIKTGKPHLGSAIKHKFDYFFRVILMKIYVYLIILIAFVAIYGLLGYILFLIINPFNPSLASTIALVIPAILTVVTLVLLHMGLIYRYPVLFMTKEMKPLKCIKQSLNHFKKYRNYTLTLWLTIVGVAIIFGIISIIISSISFIYISYLVILVGAIFQTWIDVYIFMKFKEKFSKSH